MLLKMKLFIMGLWMIMEKYAILAQYTYIYNIHIHMYTYILAKYIYISATAFLIFIGINSVYSYFYWYLRKWNTDAYTGFRTGALIH